MAKASFRKISIYILGTLLVLLVGVWAVQKYKYMNEEQDYARDAKLVREFMQKWDDERKLAGRTPRIALSNGVARLQELKRVGNSLELKTSCISSAKIHLSNAMSAEIEGFLAFMGSDEAQATIAFDKARNHYEAITMKLTACNPMLQREAESALSVRENSAKAATSVSAVVGKTFKDCPDCPEMVVIPAGSFEMGSNNGGSDEKPAHHVTIAKPFAIGKTEVTQGQWKAIMGNNPSNFTSCGDTCPVEQVSWGDAKEFIQKLNAKTGKQYRLPSETEWEYACRAGGQQTYCGGDNLDSVAWHDGNSGNSTHPVAGKQANAFNLHDMSGNVWEWVEDSYHDSYNGAPNDGSAWGGDGAKRVLRGGSWYNKVPQDSRAAYRGRLEPANRNSISGFRLARMLP